MWSTAAASPEVYFGPGNPIDAMENAHKVSSPRGSITATLSSSKNKWSIHQNSGPPIRHGAATRDAIRKL